MVSELFDPARWAVVPGFDDLTDVTYHRTVDDPGGRGTVRIAIDRPEVRNAFRPRTVEDLQARDVPERQCECPAFAGRAAERGDARCCRGV